MAIEVKIPSPGESITQVQLASWLVKNGEYVEKDQEIAEIDSDKATLAIPATESGVLTYVAQEGDTLPVGAVLCTIDNTVQAPLKKVGAQPEPKMEKAATVPPSAIIKEAAEKKTEDVKFTPLAKKILAEQGLNEKDAVDLMKKSRLTRKDVEGLFSQTTGMSQPLSFSRSVDRKKMTSLRLKLSQRLVAVKNQTAMLTTFNEVDMSAIIDLRNRYNDKFREKYGVSVGFMSLFTKAVTLALKEFPAVNSQIDGEDLLVPEYVDMGIAVSAPKGLMVPVVRNAESLTLSEIEASIKSLAEKARNSKLSLDEMTGGTFTITNGGVFGSMMSTPILNPPQSAILGMHAIIERPVAINGQVVVKPMMYIALSYDHRVIDGKESVSFLVRVKEILENPVRMLVEGKDPLTVLLGL
ncbi:MAG: 2-oxoglutarate dehydrogenase complex dihydrolipoyllysine-residue succinyltransferase [Bacteroidales bacterium]